jgi:antitoxin ParD1/3/4
VAASFFRISNSKIDFLKINWHIMPTTYPSRELAMPTRNVVLTDHQTNLVEKLVASGRYQNASEVLREGLRLVEQREAEDTYRLEALRSAVQVGIEDITAGRFNNFEKKESLRAHLKSITDKAIATK